MTIQLSDLKFPTGEFSHTELAQFNGLDRKKVWTAYQKAIADKTIVSTGHERKASKGKSAALWIVADPSKVNMSPDSIVVPVVPIPAAAVDSTDVVPTVAAKPGRKPKVKAEPVVPTVAPVEKPAEKPFETEMGGPSTPPTGGETIVEETPILSAPAVAPVQTSEPVQVVAVVPTTEPSIENLKVCIQPAALGEITPIEEKCPFCQTPLLSATTANGGVRVWCGINNLRVCSCSENPYGYSNNVKNAIQILKDKFCGGRNEA